MAEESKESRQCQPKTFVFFNFKNIIDNLTNRLNTLTKIYFSESGCKELPSYLNSFDSKYTTQLDPGSKKMVFRDSKKIISDLKYAIQLLEFEISQFRHSEIVNKSVASSIIKCDLENPVRMKISSNGKYIVIQDLKNLIVADISGQAFEQKWWSAIQPSWIIKDIFVDDDGLTIYIIENEAVWFVSQEKMTPYKFQGEKSAILSADCKYFALYLKDGTLWCGKKNGEEFEQHHYIRNDSMSSQGNVVVSISLDNQFIVCANDAGLFIFDINDVTRNVSLEVGLGDNIRKLQMFKEKECYYIIVLTDKVFTLWEFDENIQWKSERRLSLNEPPVQNLSNNNLSLNMPLDFALLDHGNLLIVNNSHHETLFFESPFSKGLSLLTECQQLVCCQTRNRIVVVDSLRSLYCYEYSNKQITQQWFEQPKRVNVTAQGSETFDKNSQPVFKSKDVDTDHDFLVRSKK